MLKANRLRSSLKNYFSSIVCAVTYTHRNEQRAFAMLFNDIPFNLQEKNIFSFYTSSKMTIGCYSASFSREPDTAIAKEIKIEEGLWNLSAGYGYNLKKVADLEFRLQVVDIMRLSAKKYARTDLLDELNKIAAILEEMPSYFPSMKKRIVSAFPESKFAKYLIAQIEKRTRDLFNKYAYNDGMLDGNEHYIFADYRRNPFSIDLFKAVLERTIGVIGLCKTPPQIKDIFDCEVRAAVKALESYIKTGALDATYFTYTLATMKDELDDLTWSCQDLGIATSDHISVADSHVHKFIVKNAMCDNFSTVIRDMTERSLLPFKCAHTFGATFLRLTKSQYEDDQKLFLYCGKQGKKIVSFRISKTRLQLTN